MWPVRTLFTVHFGWEQPARFLFAPDDGYGCRLCVWDRGGGGFLGARIPLLGQVDGSEVYMYSTCWAADGSGRDQISMSVQDAAFRRIAMEATGEKTLFAARTVISA